MRTALIRSGRVRLLDVSDATPDRSPVPAVHRDAAGGGPGLYLLTRLSAAHGWALTGGCEHVRTLIHSTHAEDRPTPTRPGRLAG